MEMFFFVFIFEAVIITSICIYIRIRIRHLMAVRISDRNQRLIILPLFPQNTVQDQGKYPLLANFARMSPDDI